MEFFFYPDMSRDVSESILKIMERDVDSREYAFSYL